VWGPPLLNTHTERKNAKNRRGKGAQPRTIGEAKKGHKSSVKTGKREHPTKDSPRGRGGKWTYPVT